MSTNHLTLDVAWEIGNRLGIAWDQFTLDQFFRGMRVELEHGRANPHTNITNDDLLMTAKIALAHLDEYPDYYDRLQQMEEKAHASGRASAPPEGGEMPKRTPASG